VDQVISEADAKHESSRCLNCCRICYNPDILDQKNQNAA